MVHRSRKQQKKNKRSETLNMIKLINGDEVRKDDDALSRSPPFPPA